MKVCADCTAIYASDLCPQCGGGAFRFDWEEEDMPKATVEGGGSDYSEGVPAIVGEHGPELLSLRGDEPVMPKPARARSETVATKVTPPAKKAPPRPPLPDGS